MLKVLLAEDEDIIREGLAQQIPWGELGADLAAAVEDGELALEAARKLKPDLVITDIKMPFMDGLEFLEAYRKENPETAFIIISGHDEFEFAQQAIRLGAYDYLLKPVNISYLGMLIRDIVEEAEKKKDAVDEDLVSAGRKQLLRDLIFKKVPLSYLQNNLEFLKMNRTGFFGVFIIQLDDFYRKVEELSAEDPEEFSRCFYRMIHEYSAANDALLETSGALHSSIICAYGDTAEEAAGILKTSAEGIKAKFGSQEIEVSVGLGSVHSGLGGVLKSWEQAREALNYKFLSGGNRILMYDQEKDGGEEISDDIAEAVRSIKDALDLLDADGFEESMDNFGEVLAVHSNPAQIQAAVRLYGTDIYLAALEVLQRQGRNAEEIFEDPVGEYNGVYSGETLNRILNDLTVFIVRIINYLVERVQTKHDRVIVKAKKFMETNFKNSELGLNDVAQTVNMSSCYFSVIFKKETGKSVIEFLTEVRVENAKNLLTRTEMMAYEVAYMVGYENPTYFSSLFKKLTGTSPSEYRKGGKG